MAYALDPAAPAHAELARCIAEQIDLARDRLGPGLADDPVKAVHEARKALKRARSAVRLGREILGGREARYLNAALRDTARRLSGARDADVTRALLRDIAEDGVGQLPAEGWKGLEEALGAGSGERGGDMALGPAVELVLAELDDVRSRLDRPPSHKRGGFGSILAGAARGQERGRRALDHARRDDRDPEVRHELRKRAKDTWHHLRLLGPLWAVPLTAEADEAHRLSDLLGDDHDAAVLAELLPTLSVAVDMEPALELLANRRAALWDQALPLAGQLYAERPKALTRRLGAYRSATRRPGSTSSSAGTGSPTTLK